MLQHGVSVDTHTIDDLDVIYRDYGKYEGNEYREILET
jgi:hypothetical protein